MLGGGSGAESEITVGCGSAMDAALGAGDAAFSPRLRIMPTLATATATMDDAARSAGAMRIRRGLLDGALGDVTSAAVVVPSTRGPPP
jgi:hypothetical protein